MTSLHPDAELACAALSMAVVTRGGTAAIRRKEHDEPVVFHSDRGSTYTAAAFTELCAGLDVRQSMRGVGSGSNATAESFFSTLEWKILPRNAFPDNMTARAVVVEWCCDSVYREICLQTLTDSWCQLLTLPTSLIPVAVTAPR